MTLALARRPERIKAFVCGIAKETTLEPVITAVQRTVENLPGVLGGINVMNAHRVLSMVPAVAPKSWSAPIMAGPMKRTGD